MDENKDISVDTGVTEATEGAGTGKAAPSADDNAAAGDVFVKVNEHTGERTVEFRQEEPEEKPPQAVENSEGEETANVEQPEEPQYYSDSEFLKAYGEGRVNPAMVTPEQQAQITAARKKELLYQQAVAERQKAEQERANQIAAARKQTLGQIASEARMMAMQQLGLSEEDLQNLEYMEGGDEKLKAFNEAYSNYFSNLQYNMVRQEVIIAQQHEQNTACKTEIANFCEHERVTEPHFEEIINLMNTARNTMPYEKAVKIIEMEQHIQNNMTNPQDLQILREYYDECKKMIYQKSAQIDKLPKRTVVPNVEKAGVPSTQSTNSLDFGKLRGMTQFNRDAAVLKYISGIN